MMRTVIRIMKESPDTRWRTAGGDAPGEEASPWTWH